MKIFPALNDSERTSGQVGCLVLIPEPSGGRGHGQTQQTQLTGTPKGLDQRSKMQEVVPKRLRYGTVKKEIQRSFGECQKALQVQVFSFYFILYSRRKKGG